MEKIIKQLHLDNIDVNLYNRRNLTLSLDTAYIINICKEDKESILALYQYVDKIPMDRIDIVINNLKNLEKYHLIAILQLNFQFLTLIFSSYTSRDTLSSTDIETLDVCFAMAQSPHITLKYADYPIICKFLEEYNGDLFITKLLSLEDHRHLISKIPEMIVPMRHSSDPSIFWENYCIKYRREE